LLHQLLPLVGDANELRSALSGVLSDGPKVNAERRQDLSRAVVQFARDPPPFVVLSLHQAL